MKGQPWLFKWRQFQAGVIVRAVRSYLRYSLSYVKSRNCLLSAASHHLEMTAALRTRARVGQASLPEPYNQVLTPGRDVRQGEMCLVLSASSCRL